MRRIYLFLAFCTILGLIFLSACSTSGGNPTAGQLAAQGKTVFVQHCVKCHGENGQKVNGSALLGPDNVLPNYPTGKALYDYVSRLMPDDQPSSLTPAQYLEVVSFLMVQDNYVKPSTPLDPNSLERISIQKK